MIRSSACVQAMAAAECLLRGGLLICPTATFYALGCLPSHRQALAALCVLKERASTKPLPLACADCEQLLPLVCAEELRALEESCPALFSFWPGPLTLLLPARTDRFFDPCLVNGRRELAVRVSAHPLVRFLSRMCASLLTVSSANLKGRPPVTDSADLDKDLLSALDACPARFAILPHAGSDAPKGTLPSTIIRPLRARDGSVVCELIRPGALLASQLTAAGLTLV